MTVDLSAVYGQVEELLRGVDARIELLAEEMRGLTDERRRLSGILRTREIGQPRPAKKKERERSVSQEKLDAVMLTATKMPSDTFTTIDLSEVLKDQMSYATVYAAFRVLRDRGLFRIAGRQDGTTDLYAVVA